MEELIIVAAYMNDKYIYSTIWVESQDYGKWKITNLFMSKTSESLEVHTT